MRTLSASCGHPGDCPYGPSARSGAVTVIAPQGPPCDLATELLTDSVALPVSAKTTIRGCVLRRTCSVQYRAIAMANRFSGAYWAASGVLRLSMTSWTARA